MEQTTFEYPCIIEVSQSKDFSNDPYMRKNKIQVCIGKIQNKFICAESKEEHVEWMLQQAKQAINSGGWKLTLGFWNYGREVMKEEKPIDENKNANKIKGSVPLSELQEFFYETGEDWLLWNEEEQGPYPMRRTLDAFNKFFEEMKLRHNQ